MTANKAVTVPGYRVTSILPEDDLSNPLAPVPSHRVYFTADNGVSSSVLVPNTQLNNVADVQTRVEAQLMQLAAIMALGQK